MNELTITIKTPETKFQEKSLLYFPVPMDPDSQWMHDKVRSALDKLDMQDLDMQDVDIIVKCTMEYRSLKPKEIEKVV